MFGKIAINSSLLSNNISTAFSTHPDLMPPPGIHIYSVAGSKSLLGRPGIVRILNGELTFQYQVSRKAAMRVWGIVSIPVEDGFQ